MKPDLEKCSYAIRAEIGTKPTIFTGSIIPKDFDNFNTNKKSNFAKLVERTIEELKGKQKNFKVRFIHLKDNNKED